MLLVYLSACSTQKETVSKPDSISGIYPSLAYYNNEGECGTGAVVPWAGDLWVITYGPHLPFGSSDKLYQVTKDYKQIVRSESVGGTPANRMIHKESNQLFIGSYAIDDTGKVRTISIKEYPGRYTGMARHLTDPENKIYAGTMEEGFYEFDVHTLQGKTLFKDGNLLRKESDAGQFSPLLPGCHGKGIYSGQGVLVYSNNGEDSKEALTHFNIEAGSLSEWNGQDWKLVRRNQFTEVTGPGGIYGNKNPESDPIWSTGWDYKSVLLGVRENGGWAFYRLPKASHSYDGAHGWNTEWPRIRDIGTPSEPNLLMTMHGLFWKFPQNFKSSDASGIRPRSAYLKVIGDFTRWNDQLVFGCDDSAQKEFLNKRKVKGSIEGPGQSNSNLWFTSEDKPDQLGPTTAEGSIWINESVKGGVPSDPFLFSGWTERCAWIKNDGNQHVQFLFEVDKNGNKEWTRLKIVEVEAKSSLFLPFSEKETGEWVRVTANKNTSATVTFSYTAKDARLTNADKMFNGIADVNDKNSSGGLLYGLGDNRRSLGILANTTETGQTIETGYYEMKDEFELVRTEDPKTSAFIRDKFAIPKQVVSIDEGSVLIVDDKDRRWRLPLGNDKFTEATNKGELRICREVATERDLFNCHGTFYELPAENADGFAKIRPIASHQFKINDYASYRGMLIITGVNMQNSAENPHIIISDDQKAAVWAGVIDDLWQMGKPTGHGGPWVDDKVQANETSDPFLIGFYDKRVLKLSHKETKTVHFTVEVDPTGNGDWMKYAVYPVKAGEEFVHNFPSSFQAKWIRFVTDSNAEVKTWLEYN